MVAMSVVPRRGSCCSRRAWSAHGFQRWKDLAPVGLAAEPVGDHKNTSVRGEETRGGNHGQQKPQAAQELGLFIFYCSWVKL